jgi:glyoxylase-like metal-dependent hydrolase (beta-lactamase superfamily II)
LAGPAVEGAGIAGPVDMTLAVETFACGPLANNLYLLIDAAAGRALAVDAPIESASVVQRVVRQRRLALDWVVLTHGHFDHMAEAGMLAQSLRCRLACHALEVARVEDPPPPVFFPQMQVSGAAVDLRLEDGSAFAFGDLSIEVLHTPGHTPGSVCLYLPAQAMLFAGDTLFAGSFGRTDLPGGDETALIASLRRLAALPPDTRVLPGHGDATTIGAETWLRRL